MKNPKPTLYSRWKNESFSFKIRTKTRILTFTTSAQHDTWSPSQRNGEGAGTKGIQFGKEETDLCRQVTVIKLLLWSRWGRVVAWILWKFGQRKPLFRIDFWAETRKMRTDTWTARNRAFQTLLAHSGQHESAEPWRQRFRERPEKDPICPCKPSGGLRCTRSHFTSRPVVYTARLQLW